MVACLPAATAANPTQTAEYTVTFDATWSAQTHPSSFPPNPHFSGLVGSTHDASVWFWQAGELASPGIENMAETGSKSPLLTEIGAAITDGSADSLISGGGINPSPGSVGVSFQIDLDFPLVTLVSMIAPSPDWFVGVSNLSLFENGDWVEERIVSLLPYDSGTDSGTTYTSPNLDTDPAEPIMQITTLFQNAPNPFNPATTVRFDLGQSGHVSLRIFDVRGRPVRTLVSLQLPRDRHAIVWDGTDDAGVSVPSGTYFYRLRASGFVQTRKLVVAK
jgi:hypothetical protein